MRVDDPAAFSGPAIGPVPVEFILFACVLTGVALFHHHTLRIALGGAIVIALYKIVFSPFKTGAGLGGFGSHLQHEWVILINLLLLLLGFALLAKQFEDTEIPAVLPRWLPDDWKGCFVLLVLVFVLSSFLDNIAAAMIGGAIAHTVFKGKVHIGFSGRDRGRLQRRRRGQRGRRHHDDDDVDRRHRPAGGARGLHRLGAWRWCCSAFRPRCSSSASRRSRSTRASTRRSTGCAWPSSPSSWLSRDRRQRGGQHCASTRCRTCFPFLGAAVWVAILLTAGLRRPDWSLLPGAFKGSVFLLSLVLCASMMPVEQLPAAVVADGARAGLPVGGVRQHPAHRAGHQAGRLRLGLPGLRGRLRRLDDLVRLVGRRGAVRTCTRRRATSGSGCATAGTWRWPTSIGFFVMLALIGFHPGSVPRGGASRTGGCARALTSDELVAAVRPSQRGQLPWRPRSAG